MKTKFGMNYDKRRNSTLNLNIQPSDKKIVLVGDSGVGKSWMFYMYTRGSHPEVYVPTLVESEQVEITPEGNDDYPLDVTVWDTAGQEEYDRLRPMSYSHTDAFIVCYSIHYPKSFSNVTSRWIPEIRHFCPDAAVILVATRTEDRSGGSTCSDTDSELSSTEPTITTKQGRQLTKRIHACAYMECCVNKLEDVSKIFEAAVLVNQMPLGQNSNKSSKGCTII